jgi:geranylgeranyl pyrophosphate synthase
MGMPLITLPQPVPIQKLRKPQDNIPQTRAERDRVSRLVREYVATYNPVPPMPMEELKVHADKLIASAGIDPLFRDYIAVTINNEAWREQLAPVPFERRLLLMPKCLRVEDKCPAPFDEFGLLCKKCGLCSIQDLQDEAEKLGYAVLVAEGSALVMSIIQTGKIEAIVGVSCLSVLEKAFPFMEAAAIPGIAIPLLQDDCVDTNVDMDAVWEIIHLTSDDKTHRLNLDSAREEVDAWFTPEVLTEIMGSSRGETDDIARQWLAKGGKRWRPFLTVCAYKALRQGDMEAPVPADLRKVAVAVECFHKASLIHDDIEDGDATRYGTATLHESHGIPVALNVGDYLLGEGYRLISECAADPLNKVEMLRVAAMGHRTLALGQGAELCWARHPKPLSPIEVLDIFRQKTAPAFEVALRLGSLYAGADEDVRDVITKYSEALGIAYQIHDDLEDLSTDGHAPDDISALRPSLLLAVAHERAKEERPFMDRVWRRQVVNNNGDGDVPARIRQIITASRADERCQNLYEGYKEEAIRSLTYLENPSLKGLLRRVVAKIFNDLQVKGWCSEFEKKALAAAAASGPGVLSSDEAARVASANRL